MGIDHRITATVESFKGLEKRRSDLIDKPGYFNEFKNIAFRASGAINKRKGFHKIASNIPASGEPLLENELGIASYAPSNELLVMNKNLKKVVEEELILTNNSADDDVIFSFLPNEDNRLEYTFKSRTTGVAIDIGSGDESIDNPGTIIITEERFATDTITVPVPAQTHTFRIENSINYGLGGYQWWWEADNNIFSSLDFRKGISFYVAANSGYYDWADRGKFFRIDFEDGSYIYSSGDSQRRYLYYKKGSDGIEKRWQSGANEVGFRQQNVGIGDSGLQHYFKYAVSMGPNGYSYQMQHSRAAINDSTTREQGTFTAYNGANWDELDFRGKTISRVRLGHDYNGQSNAFGTAIDVLAFANQEIFPSQDVAKPVFDYTGTSIPDGTTAISEMLATNYDTFFLFGDGDSDTVVGQWNYFTKTSDAYFNFKSHGDNGRVSLSIKGSSLEEGASVFAVTDGKTTDIISNNTNIPFYWTHSDTPTTNNYFTSATSVERTIIDGEDLVVVDTQSITDFITIDDLKQYIILLDHVDITPTTPVNTSIADIPACFIIPQDKIIIPKDGGSISLRYFREADVTKGDTTYDYFENLHQKFVDRSDDFQNVSTTVLNSSIYFATGFDEICKYDGSKIYRAGLPQAGTITATTSAEVSSFNIGVEEDSDQATTSYYMMTLLHEDNNGNIIQSTQSPVATLAGNTHNSSHRHLIEIDLTTVLPGTGFDLDNIKMILWRAPHTTTEDVLAASSFYKINTDTLTHQFSAAQWASLGFLPQDAQDYVNVTIDAVNPFDSTTWIYNLSNSIINNDKTATYGLKYLDFVSDEQINTNDFITTSDYAEGRHDLPPKAKFITNHQGCLVLAGTEENPNEVFYSLPEFNFITGEIGSEYFPNNSNSVLMPGSNGTNITGLKTLRETLMVFNKHSVSVLSGDITTVGVQYLKKDNLTAQGEQGTLSSNCLQEWEGTLTFLSEEAILSTNTQLSYPTEMSETIKPLVLNKKFDRKRAVSFFNADQDVIGFFIPIQDTAVMSELTTEGIFNSTMDSKLLVYNVVTGGWSEWDNIDMSGGVVRHNQETFFISRTEGKIELNIFKNASDKSSFSDFNKPIESDIITSWDSLGNSSVFKKYIRLKVFTSDSNQAFEGTKFTLNLYLRSNFDNKDIGPIVLDPGAFGGWGIAPWGEFAWGSRDFKGIKTKLFGKSKAIALRFKNNNINENILISGYAMEVASPFRTEIKE